MPPEISREMSDSAVSIGSKRAREDDYEEDADGIKNDEKGHEKSAQNGDFSMEDKATEVSASNAANDDGDWEVAASKRSKKKQKLASPKVPRRGENDYPSFKLGRGNSYLTMRELQQLVLHLNDEMPAPGWFDMYNSAAIRKVVVLMIPGLDKDVILPPSPIEPTYSDQTHPWLRDKSPEAPSPDEYYPEDLQTKKLLPAARPLAKMFRYLWTVKCPFNPKTMVVYSPIRAMLMTLLPSTKDKNIKGPQAPRYAQAWRDTPTNIKAFLSSVETLEEDRFTIHPALLDGNQRVNEESQRRAKTKTNTEHGWVDSKVDRDDYLKVSNSSDEEEKGDEGRGRNKRKMDLTAGLTVYGLDCEMVLGHNNSYMLARVCLVDWNGKVVMDELVKPDDEIIDYLQSKSGMTKELLDPVTTKLSDIQNMLQVLLTPQTILAGHSLENDMKALKMTHPFIVDTTILYPHQQGRPLKSGLKYLAKKYLSRDIQESVKGHDPFEDALAALDLVKLKCQKGPDWGTSEAGQESIFARVGRSKLRSSEMTRKTAIIDWGQPHRGFGKPAHVQIPCKNDDDVVQGVISAVKGDDGTSQNSIPSGGVNFAWARMRELEALRGWWIPGTEAPNDDASLRTVARKDVSKDVQGKDLEDAVGRAVTRIQKIYASLPDLSALVIYSGYGKDSRNLQTLLDRKKLARYEYQNVLFSKHTVQWSQDDEEETLRVAKSLAKGTALVAIK